MFSKQRVVTKQFRIETEKTIREIVLEWHSRKEPLEKLIDVLSGFHVMEADQIETHVVVMITREIEVFNKFIEILNEIAKDTPFKKEKSSMKQIPLTQGKFALVDDEDYPFLSHFNWSACKKGLLGIELYYALLTKKTRDGSAFFYMHEFLVGQKNMNLLKTNLFVKHLNGDTLDNRKENLQVVSRATIGHMARKKRTAMQSKYKGIYYHKTSGLWAARIQKDKKNYSCGYFSNQEEAALAYNEKALELYGELAYQNIIT